MQEHQMSLNVLQANWSLTWALFLEPQSPFSKGMFAYYWLQMKLEQVRFSHQPEPTSGPRHSYYLLNIYILGKLPAIWRLPWLRGAWLHHSILFAAEHMLTSEHILLMYLFDCLLIYYLSLSPLGFQPPISSNYSFSLELSPITGQCLVQSRPH